MKRIFISIAIILFGIIGIGASIDTNENTLFFNLNPGAKVSGNFTLDLTTTIPNQYYPEAGIKITTPGYSLAGVGSECIMADSGYCLFSVSDTQSKTLSISGPDGVVEMILCLNGVGPYSCQHYSQAFQYVIFATTDAGSQTDNDVNACGQSNQLTLIDCVISGSFNIPMNVTLNADKTLAYVPDYGNYSTGLGNIYVCTIDNNLQFTSCTARSFQFNPSPTYGFGSSAVLTPDGTHLYVTNCYNDAANCNSATNPAVSLCTLNSGMIQSCSNATASTTFPNPVTGFSSPISMALNQDGTIAYIGDFGGSSTIWACDVAGDGTLTSCDYAAPDATFSTPYGIAFNNTQTKVYITDVAKVTVCDVDNNGNFSGCINATPSNLIFSKPFGIALNSDSTVAYFTDMIQNDVFICAINAQGLFYSCGLTNNTSTEGPTGIALF